MCDIHSNKSTAFHPQSDGQTEHVNQILEQYLRIFCDYQQDNWLDILSLVEFAYNNVKHSSIRMSPFFANYGLHLRCTLRITPAGPGTSPNPSAEDLAQKYHAIHDQAKEELKRAQAKYQETYDTCHKEAWTFEPGDLIWLSRRHITTTHPSSKLDIKRLGPFKILEAVGDSKLAFRLELPAQMRIHSVFHKRTWEPAEHLSNTVKAVAEFHACYPNPPAPKDLSSSTLTRRRCWGRVILPRPRST